MKTALVMCAALIPSLAFAQSLEEKEWRKKSDDMVASSVKSNIPPTGVCKTTIDASIDWSTWKSAMSDDPKHKNVIAGSQCTFFTTTLANMCRHSAIAQQSIAKDVKKVVCQGDAPDAHTYELKGETLVLHVNFKNNTNQKGLEDWLEKNLK